MIVESAGGDGYSAVPDPTVRRAVIFAADGMFLRQVVPGQTMNRDQILIVLRTIAGL